jgi:hypothetical protein
MSDSWSELLSRAKERADTRVVSGEYGYRVALEEEESFLGRWRGKAVDENWTPAREVYLLWDSDDQPCFSRYYAALGRELERVKPAVGDRVAIYRGVDYTTQDGNTGYSFGVEAEPCEDPLPGADDEKRDGIPF